MAASGFTFGPSKLAASGLTFNTQAASGATPTASAFSFGALLFLSASCCLLSVDQ